MVNAKLAVFHISRLILAAVFVYAGVIKLYDPAAFYESILAYRLLPNGLSYIVAYLLPPMEILLGIGLFFYRYVKVSALSIAILNLVFIFAISTAWGRGLDISCGCFGRDDPSVVFPYVLDILRDVFFIFLAVAVANFARISKPFYGSDKF